MAILLILVMFLAYLFIAASFAPSVYGQSYPVPRARFVARVIMSGALMVEGGLLGALVAQRSIYLRRFAAFALMIIALYPLKTAQRIYPEIPAYQQRAAAWDLRESEIRALKEEGERNLVVRFLSKERIQDLGDRTGFRLNRCASILYGVESIIAVPMDK
jgi:hypothetical protein